MGEGVASAVLGVVVAAGGDATVGLPVTAGVVTLADGVVEGLGDVEAAALVTGVAAVVAALVAAGVAAVVAPVVAALVAPAVAAGVAVVVSAGAAGVDSGEATSGLLSAGILKGDAVAAGDTLPGDWETMASVIWGEETVKEATAVTRLGSAVAGLFFRAATKLVAAKVP